MALAIKTEGSLMNKLTLVLAAVGIVSFAGVASAGCIADKGPYAAIGSGGNGTETTGFSPNAGGHLLTNGTVVFPDSGGIRSHPSQAENHANSASAVLPADLDHSASGHDYEGTKVYPPGLCPPD